MKIDTSLISGYESMTPEEKINALEAFEMKEVAKDDTEINKLKTMLSNANSEAAKYKKQLREKQTDDEKNAAANQETLETMQKELDTLRKEKQLSSMENRFLSLGYDAELANKTAQAYVDNDIDTLFANQKSFLETQKRISDAEKLAASGKEPPAGKGSNSTMSRDKFLGLSTEEQKKYIEEHPNWKKELV